MDEDIVVFDLNQQSIQFKQELPSKPQPYVSFMIPKFENLVHKLNNFKTNGDHIELCKFTLRIKILFLNFILYLINDFEDFYKKENRLEPASKSATAHDVFDFKKYCKSENYKAFKERFVQS